MKVVRLLAVISIALTACSPATLAGLSAAAPTVDAAVRGACGVLLATRSPSDAAGALADGQRAIAEALARAVEAGREDDARAILRELATLAAEQRAGFERLEKIAGTATVAPMCPVVPTGSTAAATSATPTAAP